MSRTSSSIFSRNRGWTDDIFVSFLMIQMWFLQYAQCELTALFVIGKPVSQGSDFYPPESAVDGDIYSWSHTNYDDLHPWWQVDLETEHCLGRITVVLRHGCCGEYRFTAAVARAGLSSNYADNQPCGLPATMVQSTDGATVEFMCDSPRMARYVSLDIDSTSPDATDPLLQIGEVRVDEYTTGECSTFPATIEALSVIGKPASQGSYFYPKEDAVDGDIYSWSHTNYDDPHPWWQVDLETEHCLGRITVVLRQDCCGEFRFTAAVARAGPSSNYADNQPCGLPATRAQSTDGATVEFMCDSPRMARYVSLDIDSTSPDVTNALLQIGEVRVDEYTTGECSTIDATTEDPASTSGVLKADFMTSTNFKRLHKRGLIANTDPLSTKKAKSLSRCGGFCVKHAGCFSFDFAPGSSQCHLHNLNSTDIEITPNDDFSVYVLE